jgi:hypothetical protein
VYIGLRLIRYGPLFTIVDTGWCGTTVVRLRRKVAAPDPLSASPAIVRTAPTVLVTGRPGKGNGSHFCSASVAESGAAKSSGGAGTRTAAPLSRVAAEVSGLSLMVRLHGNVNSVSMLSLPPQLLRPAAAASPGRISRSQIQQRALAALWSGNDAGDKNLRADDTGA